MKLAEISIKRPVFATMMVGALLVLGGFSYMELSVQLFPDIDFPITTVVTVYPGASAETVETEVTKKVEDAANEVSGIRHIVSKSQEGYSLVIIEFELEREGAEATQDVREKVFGIRDQLPDDIEEPIISQFDPTTMPVLSVAVFGERSAREITEFVENIVKKRLESVPGVGNVTLVGGREREILVALDPEKMEAHGVTVKDVKLAVAAANMEVPGGRVDESSREYIVRMAGRVADVGQFKGVIIKERSSSPVYLMDIARVADTVKEQRSLSRYNGRSAVALDIIRQSGANVVEMARRAKQTIEELKQEMPSDIRMAVVRDDSVFIEESIHEILFNIRFGTILAVIVILLFLLDLRPTIIAGLSIPISIIATFTLMKFLGFTINFMTLLGLSLAVGILIDDAIVVIENIYRHLAEGKSAVEAAFAGTKEIGLAVMATTLAIVVVFLPVAFMSGIVGRFFYEFGMSVAFAVLVSLFVAFSLTPMLSSRYLHPERTVAGHSRNPGAASGPLRRLRNVLYGVGRNWNLAFEAIKPRYRRLLAASLKVRWLVIVIATFSFAATFFLAKVVGIEFISETDQAELTVDIETPPGTDLAVTSKRVEEAEAIIGQLSEVTARYVTIGAGNEPVTKGRILVKLTDLDDRALSARQLMDSIRVMLRVIPGIKYAIGRGHNEGGSSKPVEISIRGPDLATLENLTRQVQQIFHAVEGTVDIDNTLEKGKPEIQVSVDRKLASDLGLDLAEIALTVRSLIEGDVVTQYKEGDEDYDVRVKLDEHFRSSKEDVGRILVRSDHKNASGDDLLIPLRRVARLSRAASIEEYSRLDRQREVRVNANVLSTAYAGTVSTEIEKRVSGIDLPAGYRAGTVGTAEIMKESFLNIFKALLLSVVFIYLLLASLYESFIDPFSIMVSLPLSLVGAVLGLLGSSFSIVSLIGIVLLMGLVTKNAILLIDFVKQERRKGVSRYDAILTAGPIRLRPILMTSLATVFGMLPLALGLGPGAEMRAPMARAAIGGVLSSTFLTLVVVPVVYTLVEDFFGLFRRGKPRGIPSP